MIRAVLTHIFGCWLAIVTIYLSVMANVSAAHPVQIAIVIDDMGYRKTDISAIKLAGDFTFAIVPFAPLTQHLAVAANNHNKEVIAHIPMEALSSNHLLGQGAITADMDKKQLIEQLRSAIQDVPYAKGINNHMGSKLTTMTQPIHWIMEQLSHSQLYFLDSKTSPHSVGESIAAKYGIQTGHRHIFLDNIREHAAIERQFNQLIKIAKKHQSAIAIAHPHPQTIAFLSSIEPRLRRHNIKLVPLSKVLTHTNKLAKVTSALALPITDSKINSQLN